MGMNVRLELGSARMVAMASARGQLQSNTVFKLRLVHGIEDRTESDWRTQDAQHIVFITKSHNRCLERGDYCTSFVLSCLELSIIAVVNVVQVAGPWCKRTRNKKCMYDPRRRQPEYL